MTEEDLRVLEEGVFVVAAAAGSAKKWVVVATPGPTHHRLLPRLVETQVGCVDETTEDEVREVGDKVIKGHPADLGEKKKLDK